MIMTDKNLELIRRSIESYKNRLQMLERKDKSVFDQYGPNGCPLCHEYWIPHPEEKRCDGCPIRTDTGERFCLGTPHKEIEEFFDRPEIFEEYFDVDFELGELQCLTLNMLKYLEQLEQKVSNVDQST